MPPVASNDSSEFPVAVVNSYPCGNGTLNSAASPWITVRSQRAVSLSSDSSTEKIVLTSERKRTSRCATGAAISRVVHQMRADLPGSNAASIFVFALTLSRLVTKPGSTCTLACFPGNSRLNIVLLATGTASVNDARPASIARGAATPSDTANGPGPFRMAARLELSCIKGGGGPACFASRIVRLLVSGFLTAPFPSSEPSISTYPTRVWSSTRSLKTACDKTKGSGASSGDLSLREARSTSRSYSLSEIVTVPAVPGAGKTESIRELRCWPTATTVSNRIKISAFICRLSFSHVENQSRLPAFGSHQSTRTRDRSMDQSAETRRAAADCVTAARRVACGPCRSVVSSRSDRK